MLKILLVGLGGFCGSIGRYLMSGWVSGLNKGTVFPWGTVAINILGCLLIGLLGGLAEHRQVLNPELKLLILVGVLGGFTTFSAYSHETLVLLRDGRYTFAALNAFGQLIVGLAAAWLGFALSKLGTS